MPLPLSEIIRPTVLVPIPAMRDRLGFDVVAAVETGQYTGSFKFRAAYHVAVTVPQTFLICASSGNFGQALAYACQILGKSCRVVMPTTSARVKIEAVERFGGTVELLDVREKSRQSRLAELAREHPEAYIASPYDDPLVIEGNATLGRELSASLPPDADTVVVPVGGGGLASGVALGLERSGRAFRLFAAEPALANDFARSFKAGELLRSETETQTIADGARTVSVGNHNWPILKRSICGVIEVSEVQIQTALRWLFEFGAIRAEPTGALSLAALIADPKPFRGHCVCCVVSGGNVDPELFNRLTALTA